jgi:hypothetical protein
MLVEVAVYFKLNAENGGPVHGVSTSQEHNADARCGRFTATKCKRNVWQHRNFVALSLGATDRLI